MKKSLIFILILCLAVSFAGCGNSGNKSNSSLDNATWDGQPFKKFLEDGIEKSVESFGAEDVEVSVTSKEGWTDIEELGEPAKGKTAVTYVVKIKSKQENATMYICMERNKEGNTLDPKGGKFINEAGEEYSADSATLTNLLNELNNSDKSDK